MMAWPQLYPGKPTGNQFSGARLLYGQMAPHYGRDQAVAAGTPRIAPLGGVVVKVDQDTLYGFYTDVRYDGSDVIEKHHQQQAAGRLKEGDRFKPGDVLGYVGRPYLNLPEAERRAKADWSGSAKYASTGEHAHQETRLGGNTKADAKDPASSEIAAEWQKAAIFQAAAAAANSVTILNEQDSDMRPVLVMIDQQGHPDHGLVTYFFPDRVHRTKTDKEIYALGRAWGVLKPGQDWHEVVQRLLADEYFLAETEINAARTLERGEYADAIAAKLGK